MHIALRGSPLSFEEAPKPANRYASATMAAEEPKIIARLMPRFSTVIQSLFDVIDDVLCLYDLAVVFADQPPIRSDQHHIDEVANRTIGLFLATQLETGQRPIDI